MCRMIALPQGTAKETIDAVGLALSHLDGGQASEADLDVLASTPGLMLVYDHGSTPDLIVEARHGHLA